MNHHSPSTKNWLINNYLDVLGAFFGCPAEIFEVSMYKCADEFLEIIASTLEDFGEAIEL